MQVGSLTVQNGSQEGRVYRLDGLSVFEIGRAAGCHIKIRDEAAAMNHLRLYRNESEYTVYALSSNRPTTVNGSPIRKVVLQHGDVLGIGGTELLFELVDPTVVGEAEPERTSAVEDLTHPGVGLRDRATVETLEETRVSGATRSEKTSVAMTAPAVKSSGCHRRLTVIDGQDQGMVYEFGGKNRVILGRSATCTMRFTDGKVSREHCVIEEVRGNAIITDLDSANGTIINGERIKKTVLQPGDYIRLGFTILRYDE